MKMKKKPEEGGNWMDTYGDMVTLLLCFFVLLYSISSVDQAKWANLVKSMNPNAEDKVTQVVTDTKIKPGEDAVPGGNEGKQKFESIAENIEQQMQKMDVAVEVEQKKSENGKGFVFISYKDKVFFDGDSPVLKPEGQKVLDGLCKAIKPAAGTIKELRVLGHTAQGQPDKQNDILTDRLLAGERSARVVAYIQQQGILKDPGKLVADNYGQFHPVADSDTAEGRQKNRRAEIVITENGSTQKTLTDYYNEVNAKDTKKKDTKKETTKKETTQKETTKKETTQKETTKKETTKKETKKETKE